MVVGPAAAFLHIDLHSKHISIGSPLFYTTDYEHERKKKTRERGGEKKVILPINLAKYLNTACSKFSSVGSVGLRCSQNTDSLLFIKDSLLVGLFDVTRIFTDILYRSTSTHADCDYLKVESFLEIVISFISNEQRRNEPISWASYSGDQIFFLFLLPL